MYNEIMVELVIKIISILIAILTFIISLLKIYRQNIEREQKQTDMFNRVFDELDGVKKRLDEHNHYAEKFGSVEKMMISISKDIEYLKKGK